MRCLCPRCGSSLELRDMLSYSRDSDAVRLRVKCLVCGHEEEVACIPYSWYFVIGLGGEPIISEHETLDEAKEVFENVLRELCEVAEVAEIVEVPEHELKNRAEVWEFVVDGLYVHEVYREVKVKWKDGLECCIVLLRDEWMPYAR